ncbi:MAG: hypothetical protein ABSG46_20290 [Candidatus Binataceae bacterium]
MEPVGGALAAYSLQMAHALVSPAAGAPEANEYQFITTNILTGAVLADNLPMIGQTATRQINNVGQFQGYLALKTADAQMLEVGIDPVTSSSIVQTWVNACIPWKSVLWILQNGQPIFNGPITAWSPDSIMDGQLPIQAASMEQMFQCRVTSKVLTYTNLDVFEIFRDELQYALSKSPNGQIAGSGQYANTSGIVDTVEYSGVIASITEEAGYQSIYDNWNDLVNAYGLEFALTPAITPAGSLYTQVQLGLPQMGRLYQNTGLQFVFPGQGMVDYAWQWIPTSPANSMTVTGQGGGTNPKTYVAVALASSELSAGWPLLEATSSFYGTVTSQTQINGYAKELLYTTAVNKSLQPIFTLGPQAPVQIKDTQLGDEVYCIATSPLHPAGANGVPGIAELLRITSWTLTFPTGEQAEQTQFTLGGLQIGPTP